MQAHGRAPHVALLGDGDEILELRQTHGAKFSSARRQIEKVLDRRGVDRQSRGMAIEILGAAEVAAMRRAGRAAAATLAAIAARIAPGISTGDIDAWVREDTRRRGGRPSQLGYHGFPAAVCTSRNAVVCHGIPSPRERLAPGDIINVDVTTELGGFHGDTSATFFVGAPGAEARHVVETARRCRDAGIAEVRDGARLGDIGAAIEELAAREGCSVVRDFGGHGIGRAHARTADHRPRRATRARACACARAWPSPSSR